MYVEPIELEPGDSVSSPVTKAFGLFDHGIIREPRGRTSQFAMVSNGKINLNNGDTVRTSGILGTADVPVLLCYKSEEVQAKIKVLGALMFGDPTRMSELLASIDPKGGKSGWSESEFDVARGLKNMRDVIPIGFGNTGNADTDTLQDVITRTGNMPPDIGLIAQREENGWLTITGDRQFLTLALNVLQMNMTEIARLNFGQPELRVIGMGLFCKDDKGDGFRLKKRPGLRMRIAGTDEFGVFSLREDPYQFAAKRQQAVVTAILGDLLSYWFPIAGLEFNDFAAIASIVLLEYAGSGDIKISANFEAGDIVGEVFKYVGMGESLAYRFNPADDGSVIIRLFTQIFLGWVANRFKSTVLPATIYPTGKAYAYKIASDFELFSRPQLPGIGSGSSPYFIFASNDVRLDTPIPCLVDRDGTSELHWLPTPTSIKFQTADVMMGEVPKAAVDQKATDEVWFRWRVKSDSKSVTLDRFMRTLLQFRWPVWHLIKNKISPVVRRLAYGMNMLTTESTTLADGTLLQAGLGIIPWSPVTVILNQRYELTIVKADTSTVGAQELRPGAVSDPPRAAPPPLKAEELAAAQSNPRPSTPPASSEAPPAGANEPGKPA